ncbi:hypothetical protein SDC9_65630 [bioreactor metagenome]|uniref:Methyl-accepting transducer domain-containing protein n=1 Tax=bioreactor metagenome TaxID=1076179 RepID=A0A644XSJ4_9ZZZZ
MTWKHKIPQELAQKVVNLLYEAIGCNVNIMGNGGEIIATMQKNRLGNIHEGGRRVVAGESDYVSINEEMAKMMNGVLPGYMGPIELEGQRIGCIGITGDPEFVKPMQKLAVMIILEELAKDKANKTKQTMITNIAGKIQDASASIQEASAGAQEIASTSRALENAARKIDGNVNEINRVIDLVGNIVQQTNLLGLNAAIEAARAGEHGRGFSIVADEVRKLSADSAKSLKDVRIVLDEIKCSMDAITRGAGQTVVTTGEQASALQVIGANIVEINDEVQVMVN